MNPAGAAIQFWGNNTVFPGQAYIDFGATESAAVIFRTAPAGGTIAERMRITSRGQVAIGTTNPIAALDVTAPSSNTAIDAYSNYPNGTGIIGEDSNGAASFGVWGINNGGCAGVFSGNVYVTGTLSVAGSKNFIMDDPSDPQNKYLYHASSVESNNMVNMYSGNITTDSIGTAVVQLPSYFDAINTDVRYQLTPIGQFAQVMVASKEQNNRFTIKTDKPNVEVSWQVTATRNDAYGRANPFVDERDKPPAERGSYVQPQLRGQPQSKSMEYARNPQETQRVQQRNNAGR